MKTTQKGNLKIEINETEHYRFANITPKGFWSDVVHVSQHQGYSTNPEWEEPEISWASGGFDRTLSSLESTETFIDALMAAIRICRRWRVKP